jgi:predicted nucleic acid-binding protein
MAGRYPSPVFLDATVVSNFASTDGIGFLTTVLESPVVVPAVRKEVERGARAGYEYLGAAVDALGESLFVREVPSDAGGSDVRDRLDAGESESVLGVLAHGGTVATDDLAARRVAKSREIPVTGSIGHLVLGVERGKIDSKTADEWLDGWRDRRGYYAPVESVTELLGDEREELQSAPQAQV